MVLGTLISGTRKKYYNPPDRSLEDMMRAPHSLQLLGTYRPKSSGRVQFFYYHSAEPKSLAIELKRYDMAGIIIDSSYVYPPTEDDKRPKVYLLEDEFDSSVIGDVVEREYTAIYPESYKGLVTYYVGCESLESGQFDRPLKDNGLESDEGPRGSLGVSSQTDYNHGLLEPRRRRVYTNSLD
ncbi:hypothetical protein TWF718_005335 [Orbilia javanica]|uniref:Uncharacterized protein n=1 Tax=Orbilia javanica TaxID=47235 RepID=A0AAN8MRV0_9PEZI